jgi:hypothetical protein
MPAPGAGSIRCFEQIPARPELQLLQIEPIAGDQIGNESQAGLVRDVHVPVVHPAREIPARVVGNNTNRIDGIGDIQPMGDKARPGIGGNRESEGLGRARGIQLATGIVLAEMNRNVPADVACIEHDFEEPGVKGIEVANIPRREQAKIRTAAGSGHGRIDDSSGVEIAHAACLGAVIVGDDTVLRYVAAPVIVRQHARVDHVFEVEIQIGGRGFRTIPESSPPTGVGAVMDGLR